MLVLAPTLLAAYEVARAACERALLDVHRFAFRELVAELAAAELLRRELVHSNNSNWTGLAPDDSPLVLLTFPGGGYQTLAIDLEGTEAYDWLTFQESRAYCASRMHSCAGLFVRKLRGSVTPEARVGDPDRGRRRGNACSIPKTVGVMRRIISFQKSGFSLIVLDL